MSTRTSGSLRTYLVTRLLLFIPNVLVILTIVFLVSFVFSEEGIAELRQAQTRVDALENEIRALEAANARLEVEIRNLRESNFAVERIAREDLGMSRPGEVVYRIEEPTKGVDRDQ